MLAVDSLNRAWKTVIGQPPACAAYPPVAGPLPRYPGLSFGGINLARGQTVFPSVYGEPFWELWLAYRVRRVDFLKIVLPCKREHDF